MELLRKIRRRIYRRFEENRIKTIHRLHRNKHTDVYNRINAILDAFHGAGGLKHEFQAYKLFSLNRILEEQNPKTILELGTGSTTPVFSDYVKQSNDRCLTAVDQDEKWLKNSMALANVEKDDERFRFILSEKTFLKDRSPWESKYDVKLEAFYDLVFIDGPSLVHDGVKNKDAVNSNIFDLAFPHVVLVDIRRATVDEIVKRMGDHYDCVQSDVISKRFHEEYKYFTEFYLKRNVENSGY